jgi:hypothetical protein
MYEGWRITRWETPVVDLDRLLMVSLTDANQELVVVFEGPPSLGRPRWRVTFRRYPAYRNIDESYRVNLWKWLEQTGQRNGFTFTVEETPRFASWETGYLEDVAPNTRHFVITTEDDVVEVLSAEQPSWQALAPALSEERLPGKARHLYRGEDDAAIDRILADLKSRNDP